MFYVIIVENRINKFTFTRGKDIKKCFHHTVEVANDAQLHVSVICIKVTPSEIVIGGFQPVGAGGRWNGIFGQKYVCRIKVNIQSFQLGAARE
ncbi:hypothetical protein A2U01_0071535, partial [Trifolium medium]|nr:hypothetical protein [Trifolium medium]